jgi:transposase
MSQPFRQNFIFPACAHRCVPCWFRSRTENVRGTRKTMIVALARKLLISLWRLVRDGVLPDGVILRAAQRRWRPQQ